MTVQELIAKYTISIHTDGVNISIGNSALMNKDKTIDEIKTKKPEILDILRQEKAEKEKAASERKAKIDAIEGLAEIKQAKREIETWRENFNRSFEGEYGGRGVGQKPNYDIKAMCEKYPAAASYLRAESEMFKSNYQISAIGKKALEAIIENPENHAKIIAEMEKELKQLAEKYLFD